MPRQAKPPTDLTGRKSEQLAAEHAEELKRREGEIAMMTAAQEQELQEGVFDPSTGGRVDVQEGDEVLSNGPLYVDDDTPEDLTTGGNVDGPRLPIREDDEVLPSGPVIVGGGAKVIRVNTKLEEVTIGQGNTYTFEPGKQYRVPAHVAAHLEEKGYIYH